MGMGMGMGDEPDDWIDGRPIDPDMPSTGPNMPVDPDKPDDWIDGRPIDPDMPVDPNVPVDPGVPFDPDMPADPNVPVDPESPDGGDPPGRWSKNSFRGNRTLNNWTDSVGWSEKDKR